MKADLSRARRRHVAGLLRRTGVLESDLDDTAKLTYVIGALVCNDVGYLTRADLNAACADPSIIQAARTIIAKAVHP